jgi:arsenite methyltransferase
MPQGQSVIPGWKNLPLVLVLVLTTSCLSSMREYRGHTIFNPLYLFYLESPSRDEWQKPEQVIEALALPEGAVVADIGAGGGYFTEKLARHVGPSGHVYATDVQPVMLKKLRQRAQKAGLTNVSVIQGAFDDPNLPPQSCDLVFFSSVYKEIYDRGPYLSKVRNALKKEGHVAILEFRPDAAGHGPPRRYRLPPSQVNAELQSAGFTPLRSFDFLPGEYFLIFGREAKSE